MLKKIIIMWEMYVLPEMKCLYKKMGLLTLAFLFCLQAITFAAPANLSAMRSSVSADKVRIVFDVDSIPAYNVTTANDGQQIILDLPGLSDARKIKTLALRDDLVKNVAVSNGPKGLHIVIDLDHAADYVVKQLKNPNRLFIDISKASESKTTAEMAPGMVETTYVRRDGRGMLTAYLLDVDTSKYTLRPAIANGVIAGRGTVSSMSDQNNALAAVNASYFALDGELLGVTKLDGKIVSTIDIPRTAVGFLSDGSPVIGTINYNGTIKTKKTVVPIAGVNCERSENSAVVYNEYYDDTTGTNEYGKEYVVKDNKVIAINTANSPLAKGTVVVSVHGTAADALADVKVGDSMQITEDIGDPWNKATQIMGVGPRLVAAGQVNVTADQEQFGGDVAGGRAPRTGVGILPNKHVLLAVVDGRQEQSIGCTLTEFAQLLKNFGVVDAVNFDGGGSSELVVGGKVLNSPSDGSERSVGSALVVCSK